MRVWILKYRKDCPEVSTESDITNLGFPETWEAKPKPYFYTNFKILKLKQINNVNAVYTKS